MIPQGAQSPDNENFYIPEEVSIQSGQTIKWINNDTAIHTATSGTAEQGPSGVFDSSLIAPGGIYNHTFTEAGKIPYFCTLHP